MLAEHHRHCRAIHFLDSKLNPLLLCPTESIPSCSTGFKEPSPSHHCQSSRQTLPFPNLLYQLPEIDLPQQTLREERAVERCRRMEKMTMLKCFLRPSRSAEASRGGSFFVCRQPCSACSFYRAGSPALPKCIGADKANIDMREAICAQNDVAFSLTKQLLSESKGSNLVFSPLSIHILISLITTGSGGSTRSKLLSFLKSQSVDHLNSFASELVAFVISDGSHAGGPKLSFANGLWLDSSLSLKPQFKQVVDTMYKAATHLADFKTKAVEVPSEVNSWAEKETSGLIKEVLSAGSVDANTRLIFANALYFKGAWNEKFELSETRDAEFYLLDGSSVQVPFMTSKKKQTVSAFDGFKVLRLPYKRGNDRRNFAMYFFLPDTKDGLPYLAEKVCSEPGFLDRHLPQWKVEVGDFRIPRFKISFGFAASEVLKKLGVVGPFLGGLTEMVDSVESHSLYVSDIFHKSFIEVNEEGTEAAAASTFILRGLMLAKKIDFVADHPFLFLIRENMTGMVLFIGQVLNPLTV